MPQDQDLGDVLDADIARVRAEIQSLTKRKQLLTSSLLSSTKVQSRLDTLNRNPSISEDDSSLPATGLTPLQSQAQHNETNIHRIAYGVTSFPFTDPNPDTSNRPLLGVRFDIPSRTGRFDKAPYYLFLKRVHEQDSAARTTDSPPRDAPRTSNDLKIHHHTIPALVPLQDYEARYLPQSACDTTLPHDNQGGGDEGYFSPLSVNDNHRQDNSDLDSDEGGATDRNNGTSMVANSAQQTQKPSGECTHQDLHSLVTAVRRDLVSWQLRTEAISLLAEQLNLGGRAAAAAAAAAADGSNHDETVAVPVGKFAVQLLQATAVDARFCRVVWQNGTVGRLRLTDDGYIDRAVVIGDLGGDGGRTDRMRDVERILTSSKGGGRLKVVDLSERLEEVARRLKPIVTEARDDTESREDMELDDTAMTTTDV